MTTSDFIEGMRATADHVKSLEEELAREKLRNAHQEIVLKILARRTGGLIRWTPQELHATINEDDRCVVIGALDLELYGDDRQHPSA